MVAFDRSPAAADEFEAERARLFALLGRLLAAPPDEALLRALSALDGDGSDLGRAYADLGRAARLAEPKALEREFFDLFVGVGRGEVLPHASYHLTGFLNDRPLARLRGDLARLGVERAPGSTDPEDHLGFVCETYAGLLAGSFGDGPDDAAGFLRAHLLPWAERCFGEVEAAGAASFYRAVGGLGRTAVAIERAALELSA